MFVLSNGELTEDDPNLTTPSLYPKSKPPVARVLNSKEIIFMQGLGKVGPRGLNPESINTIGDVTISSANNGAILAYTGSPQMWRNNAGSPAISEGDILYFHDQSWKTLRLGSSGQVLTVGSPLLPAWVNPLGGSPSPFALPDTVIQLGSPSTGSPTLGSILYDNGSGQFVRLPRGTSGQVLTMGSPLLPSWQSASAGGSPVVLSLNKLSDVVIGSPTTGAVLYNNGTNWIVLPKGTAGQVLTTGSPLVSWQTASAADFGSPYLTALNIAKSDLDLYTSANGSYIITDSDFGNRANVLTGLLQLYIIPASKGGPSAPTAGTVRQASFWSDVDFQVILGSPGVTVTHAYGAGSPQYQKKSGFFYVWMIAEDTYKVS